MNLSSLAEPILGFLEINLSCDIVVERVQFRFELCNKLPWVRSLRIMTAVANNNGNGKNKVEEETHIPFDLSSIFWRKATYHGISDQFHPFHKHDMNVFCHVITTGVGVWGALQLVNTIGELPFVVYAYAALIFFTTPLVTAVLHTAFIYGCLLVPVTAMQVFEYELSPLQVCGLAIALGYGLQDLSHFVFQEKTYMASYIGSKPWMLIVHSIWLMPLVIDSMLMRWCFLPKLFVSRNRNVICDVASRQAVEELREWINSNVPDTKETTHVWPHKQEATAGPTLALENDASIYAAFRKVFALHHYDIRPIQGMNEIYVTAVGAKKEMNSDAVFYTPHCDGPYWFLPFASVYRVLVGVTPNTMVRTRFNLQHEDTENQVLDIYGVVGFDYNRELHWIDHVPGEINDERRSLVKLHFVVYPKGWQWYGNLVASLNQGYNTWARKNFLRTLRPKGLYEVGMAWWIWITTWTNYRVEETIGWPNIVYILTTFALGPTPFLILTSFRHYCIYLSTFAFRSPPVAHGQLMRDAKLFKTLALLHLGRRLLPLVQIPQDLPGVLLASMGFGVTILATIRLGMVRTYFGSELGFVEPKWISGFPYGTIAHPMIVGQLFAYTCILYWFDGFTEDGGRLGMETVYLICTHMMFYSAHMVQEMFLSSY